MYQTTPFDACTSYWSATTWARTAAIAASSDGKSHSRGSRLCSSRTQRKRPRDEAETAHANGLPSARTSASSLPDVYDRLVASSTMPWTSGCSVKSASHARFIFAAFSAS